MGVVKPSTDTLTGTVGGVGVRSCSVTSKRITMDYEKKYKEALKKAEAFYFSATTEPITEREVLANIFPELKESDDEKVRKEIIEFLKHTEGQTIPDKQYDSWLAWLEKQGDKPFDYENANIQQMDFAPRVEPKFHEGDFIVNDYCMGKVIELTDDAYLLDTGQGIPFSCEHNVHLWTIADAKDGDVLQLGVVTAIFKESIGNGNCKCYCSVCNGEFEIPSQDGADNSYGCHNATPATKEQRGLLFQKMKEAGYEWDADAKKLNKFEKKTDSGWSEEDELMRNNIISLLVRISARTRTDSTSPNFSCPREIDWLKSLKERYIWKPSDEQMEALLSKLPIIKGSGDEVQDILESLYQDLEKLREE